MKNTLWLLKTTNNTLLPFYGPENWSMSHTFHFAVTAWESHLTQIKEIACTCFRAPAYENTES